MSDPVPDRVESSVVAIATAADVAAIKRVVDAAYAKYIERLGRLPAAITADYGKLAETRSLHVLRADGAVVVLSRDGDSIKLSNLVVDPAAQGRGYGRVLMDYAEEMARSQGLAAVTLFTNEKMHENIALYRKIGFTETGRKTEDGFARVFFRKNLTRVMQSEKPRPMAQKTIGILGGMSNQATGEYYRLINKKLNDRLGGWDNGEIVIVSVNFGNIAYFVRNDRWDEAHAYLSDKADRLERAGADLVICVSNTMHRVVEPIMAERKTPFIHIADPTGQAIRQAGISRVGLLGTMPVMTSAALRRRYQEGFGVEVVAPTQGDMEIVDRIIFNELVRGELRADSKREYLRIVGELRERGAAGVILGCTEIFLLIAQEDLPGFPVFDTTELHVQAAVDFALG